MQCLKKITAALLSVALMFTLSSCVFETRETYEVDDSGEHVVTYEDGEEPVMTVAEKTNSVDANDAGDPLAEIIGEQQFITDPEEPETVIRVAVSGDILMDSVIIADAAKAAADDEEKDYSFLKMFTGALRTLNDADLSVGAFSSMLTPASPLPDYDYAWDGGEDTEDADGDTTPAEALDAVLALGYKVLDTSGAGDCSGALKDREITEISDSLGGDNGIKTVEVSGVTFAFLSAGDDESAQPYNGEKFGETLEYADLISDILIVFVHWEYGIDQDGRAEVAARIADLGADMIIGDGDSIGKVEWIKTEDGRMSLAAYSLGNLLSSADEGYRLCSGILTFSVLVTGDMLEITDAMVVPEFVFYTPEKDGFQVYRMEDCNSEVTAAHGAEVSVDGLKDFVMSRIDQEFLSEKFSDKISNR